MVMERQQVERIRFYCGLGNERTWNYHPVAPGPYACVAPVYGRRVQTKQVNRVVVPAGTQVLQDSGAFSDGPAHRLSMEEALDRQRLHAQTFGYAAQVTYRASYDVLIDEKWMEGTRYKVRWSEQDAHEAVDRTVQAAAYLARHREGVKVVLSAQGVSPEQYLRCAQRIVPYLEAGDIFGLGGWCILGKRPSLLPLFRATMQLVIPFLAREQVEWVHVWGSCYAPALHDLLWLTTACGMHLSTDSVHPSTHPVFGQWGYADWRDNTYVQPPILDSCRQHAFDGCVGCRGLERARHVAATRRWLASFSMKPYQRCLWEVFS